MPESEKNFGNSDESNFGLNDHQEVGHFNKVEISNTDSFEIPINELDNIRFILSKDEIPGLPPTDQYECEAYKRGITYKNYPISITTLKHELTTEGKELKQYENEQLGKVSFGTSRKISGYKKILFVAVDRNTGEVLGIRELELDDEGARIKASEKMGAGSSGLDFYVKIPGEGIGATLTTEAIQYAVLHGKKNITSGIFHNQYWKDFFKRLGFNIKKSRTGEETGYLNIEGEQNEIQQMKKYLLQEYVKT